jgi:uncharacterized protein
MANLELYIGETGDKGRGVFTEKEIEAGATVETAPVIVMSGEERKLLDQTLLHDYIFEWEPGGQKMCCMALGWIPLYNHSHSANCEYFMDYDSHLMYIQTVRDIVAGEELTINYNGDWNNEEKVWFEMKP